MRKKKLNKKKQKIQKDNVYNLIYINNILINIALKDQKKKLYQSFNLITHELHIKDQLDQLDTINIDIDTDTYRNLIKNIDNKNINKNIKNEQKEKVNDKSQREDIKESKELISTCDFVHNIMFLGLDASFLITITIPHFIGIIYNILCIFIIGAANTWSYYMISIIYEKKKEKDEETNNNYNLWNKIFEIRFFGKLLKTMLFITLDVYSIGEIIIHQILIYSSLGGVINILGGYNYELVSQFLLHSFLSEKENKFIINFFISIFIIFPACLFYLNINYKQLNILSIIGVNIILFIVIAIIFQSPFYLIDFLDEEKGNIKDIIFNNKKLFFIIN